MAKLDTSIDRLVDYVKLKNSCTVDDAAKSLGIPVKQIEELSEILAESGLIDVRYDFSGIRLSPKIVKKEAGEDKGAAVRKLTVIDRLEGVKRELIDAENMFVFSEKDIRRKVENAKAHFREIEKLDLSQENPENIKRKVAELDTSVRVFEDKISAFEKAAVEVQQEVDAFELQLEKSASIGKVLRLPSLNLKGLISRISSKVRRRPAAARVDAK